MQTVLSVQCADISLIGTRQLNSLCHMWRSRPTICVICASKTCRVHHGKNSIRTRRHGHRGRTRYRSFLAPRGHCSSSTVGAFTNRYAAFLSDVRYAAVTAVSIGILTLTLYPRYCACTRHGQHPCQFRAVCAVSFSTNAGPTVTDPLNNRSLHVILSQ